MRFLQGRDPGLALRIVGRDFLPEGPRFAALSRDPDDDGDEPRWPGPSARSASHDRAKHLASLYVDDLADVIRDGIDPRFELSRYGEKLAASAPRFDPLRDALDGAADPGRRARSTRSPRELLRRSTAPTWSA